MKETTLRESMLAFSKALDSLIDRGAPVDPAAGDALRAWWLSGNLFYFDFWNRFDSPQDVHIIAAQEAEKSLQRMRDAGISIPEASASVLVRWFISGAIWAFDNRVLERERKILVPH